MNRPALALCLLALAVGGCGGDDDEPSGNAPTRAEYIAAGDEICTQVNEKTAELNREVDEIERTATDQARRSPTQRRFSPRRTTISVIS